jgi:hypothetical protein
MQGRRSKLRGGRRGLTAESVRTLPACAVGSRAIRSLNDCRRRQRLVASAGRGSTVTNVPGLWRCLEPGCGARIVLSAVCVSLSNHPLNGTSTRRKQQEFGCASQHVAQGFVPE